MTHVGTVNVEWKNLAPPAYEPPSEDYLLKQLQEKHEQIRADESAAAARQAAAIYAVQQQVLH